MKSSVTHGYISRILGFCTLLPIIKDKLGSFEDSSNYRSIAISSVILKLFDWVLILLYNDKLHLDHLQFSYQKNCSTSMCTWMVIETIDYFMRNGSDVFVCTMDMSKAFDNVRHSLLFNKLLERGIPPIILRFIIYMYEVQTANVRWNSEVSSHFKLKNGVKQGGVLSALFYCVYTDDLFNNLRKERNGCWVSGEYMGILGYADDNVLLSPTIDGLQCMLRVCEEYAKEHNLTFSTNINVNKSKTKCMAFTKCDRALPSMSLNGNNLPWVKSIKHLGNKVENKIDGMCQDMKEKRAQFIQRNNEICQEFSFADPQTKIKLNDIYNSHFTGSNTWNLFCKEAESIEKTWNVAMRKMLGIDRCTHKYFVEPLSGTTHISTRLMKRFAVFIKKIESTNKIPMRVLYKTIRRDCRSVTGRNLRNIMLLVNAENVDAISAKSFSAIRYHDADDIVKYQSIEMAKELIEVRSRNMYIDNMGIVDINEILDHICIS